MLRIALIALLAAAAIVSDAAAAPFRILSRHVVSGPVTLADGCPASASENTPLVAVDPGDSRHLAVTYAIGDGSASVLAQSRDGGSHWQRTPIRGTVVCDGDGGAYTSRFDPDLAFAPDGRLFLTESLQAQGMGTAGIATLAGTVAPGATDLGPAVPVTPSDPLVGTQRGFLAFDDAGGPGTAEVLTERFPYPGTYAPTGLALELEATHDGGRSWTGRTIFRQGVAGTSNATNPITALGLLRHGRVVLAAGALNDASSAVPGQPPGNSQGEAVLRSTDGGTTFGPPVQVARSQLCVCKPAQGPGGTTYLLAPQVDGAVDVYRSDDLGATWSALHAARYPGGSADAMIAAGPHGRVAIVVYALDGEQARLHILTSPNRGRGWRDRTVGAAFPVADIGPVDDTSPLGPVQGIAATRDGFVVAATVPGEKGAGDIDLFTLGRRKRHHL